MYTVNIPLSYNTYDIRTREKDSELLWGIKSPIRWKQDNYSCVLSCRRETNDLPSKFIDFSIRGIMAKSEDEAIKMVDPIIISVCQSLSIAFSMKNVNKDSFQERVIPCYDKMEWSKEDDKSENIPIYIDQEGNRVIKVTNRIKIGESIHTTLYSDITEEMFMQFYSKGDVNPALEFVKTEFYTALGTETAKSKFFHLMSIIEFIEKEYFDLSEAKLVFPDENERNEIIKLLKESYPNEDKRKQRLFGSLQASMSKITDIGREEKLLRILKNMGITFYKCFFEEIPIDKCLLVEITNLRNKSFHGGIGKEDHEPQITCEKAVLILFSICEEIIVYMVKHASEK